MEYQLADLRTEAAELFGSRTAADDWMRQEQPALDFQRPIDLAGTTEGLVTLRHLLGRIRHNVYT